MRHNLLGTDYERAIDMKINMVSSDVFVSFIALL